MLLKSDRRMLQNLIDNPKRTGEERVSLVSYIQGNARHSKPNAHAITGLDQRFPVDSPPLTACRCPPNAKMTPSFPHMLPGSQVHQLVTLLTHNPVGS